MKTLRAPFHGWICMRICIMISARGLCMYLHKHENYVRTYVCLTLQRCLKLSLVWAQRIFMCDLLFKWGGMWGLPPNQNTISAIFHCWICACMSPGDGSAYVCMLVVAMNSPACEDSVIMKTQVRLDMCTYALCYLYLVPRAI